MTYSTAKVRVANAESHEEQPRHHQEVCSGESIQNGKSVKFWTEMQDPFVASDGEHALLLKLWSVVESIFSREPIIAALRCYTSPDGYGMFTLDQFHHVPSVSGESHG